MKKPALHLGKALGHVMTDKRIDILRRIGACGSISQAAREAGVSYKAAWQAIETLGNLAGEPLVKKAVGGSGGGGAQLTPAGTHLLRVSSLLDGAKAGVLAALGKERQQVDGDASLAALALRTSMRNQFPCTVRQLAAREGLIRVKLVLPDDTALFSKITRESAQLLGLHPGMAVLALCKATAVKVAASVQASVSANLMEGIVSRISRAAAGGEAVLRVGGGVQIVGFVSPGHGLGVGAPAMASVDQSGVVIGLPGK
ncbi:MAG: TOBE domain-containing protein [Burkholderiaceae bacterium]